MKLTKHELVAGLLAVVILLTLILLPKPAGAAAQPYCYRDKAGVVVCYVGGQSPAGGSGITPVKRFGH